MQIHPGAHGRNGSRSASRARHVTLLLGSLSWSDGAGTFLEELDLLLSDAQTDFSSDRIDVAFRNGRMEDSQIIARQIVPMQMLLCAAPDYAKSHGMPRSLDELARHDCINFRLASGRLYEWDFKVQRELHKITPAS